MSAYRESAREAVEPAGWPPAPIVLRTVSWIGAGPCIDLDLAPDPAEVALVLDALRRRLWIARIKVVLAWIGALGASVALAWCAQ